MLNQTAEPHSRTRRARLRRSTLSAASPTDFRKTRRLFGRSSTVGLAPLLGPHSSSSTTLTTPSLPPHPTAATAAPTTTPPSIITSSTSSPSLPNDSNTIHASSAVVTPTASSSSSTTALTVHAMPTSSSTRLSHDPSDDDNGRRSFLAKPPTPGAARRVLTVLNQPQKAAKRAATFVNARPAQAVRSAVSASGYDVDVHNNHHEQSSQHETNLTKQTRSKSHHHHNRNHRDHRDHHYQQTQHHHHHRHRDLPSLVPDDRSPPASDVNIVLSPLPPIPPTPPTPPALASHTRHLLHSSPTRDISPDDNDSDDSDNNCTLDIGATIAETPSSPPPTASNGNKAGSSTKSSATPSSPSPSTPPPPLPSSLSISSQQPIPSSLSSPVQTAAAGDPDRRVVPPTSLRDDASDAVVKRSDSAGSSRQSSLRGRGSARLIEAEASEVSDDINSSDPKSRTSALAMSAAGDPPSSRNPDDLIFDDAPDDGPRSSASAVLLPTVGEEDPPVPLSSPASYGGRTNSDSHGGSGGGGNGGGGVGGVCSNGGGVIGASNDGCDGNNARRFDAITAWASFEHRVHALSTDLCAARDAAASQKRANVDLRARNRHLETLLGATRTRSTEALAEVDSLTRQLKDTRKRLTRRVRDLEDALTRQSQQFDADQRHQRDVERRLRNEIRALRAGTDPDDVAVTPLPLLTANGYEPSAPRSLPMATPLDEAATTYHALLPVMARARSVSAIGDGNNGNGGPNTSNSVNKGNGGHSTSANINSARRKTTAANGGVNGIGAHARNAGSAARPRTPVRRTATAAGGLGGTGGSGAAGTGLGSAALMPISGCTNGMGMNGGSTSGGGFGVAAEGSAAVRGARTLARRNLLRRAFIAHIHSTKYRSVRAVWGEFFRVDGNVVTPEQFSRAVRGLALAADARDRDLELLRDEVAGAEEGDTGALSWAMFAQFYQRTKNEST